MPRYSCKIGLGIKIERIRAGLQSQELAEATGVSANYISLLEGHKREPSFSWLLAAARALGCKVSQIVASGEKGER